MRNVSDILLYTTKDGEVKTDVLYGLDFGQKKVWAYVPAPVSAHGLVRSAIE